MKKHCGEEGVSGTHRDDLATEGLSKAVTSVLRPAGGRRESCLDRGNLQARSSRVLEDSRTVWLACGEGMGAELPGAELAGLWASLGKPACSSKCPGKP